MKYSLNLKEIHDKWIKKPITAGLTPLMGSIELYCVVFKFNYFILLPNVNLSHLPGHSVHRWPTGCHLYSLSDVEDRRV